MFKFQLIKTDLYNTLILAYLILQLYNCIRYLELSLEVLLHPRFLLFLIYI